MLRESNMEPKENDSNNKKSPERTEIPSWYRLCLSPWNACNKISTYLGYMEKQIEVKRKKKHVMNFLLTNLIIGVCHYFCYYFK